MRTPKEELDENDPEEKILKFSWPENLTDKELDELVETQIYNDTASKSLKLQQKTFRTDNNGERTTKSYAKFHKVRSFLLNFGLFDYQDMRGVIVLNEDEELRKNLLELDTMATRAQIKVLKTQFVKHYKLNSKVNVLYCESPYSCSYQNFSAQDNSFKVLKRRIHLLIIEILDVP